MRDDTGATETQIIIYAIQRGSYDRDLSKIATAIDQRRVRLESVGHISPSLGDWVILWDDESCPHEFLRGAKLRVVGFTNDKRIKGRLEEPNARYERGVILGIRPDWVYEVEYYAKIETPLRPRYAPE